MVYYLALRLSQLISWLSYFMVDIPFDFPLHLTLHFTLQTRPEKDQFFSFRLSVYRRSVTLYTDFM